MLVEIFNVIAPVFFCALIGFIWAKSNTEYPSDFVSRLVFNLGAPCLIISSISQVDLSKDAFWQMALATLLTLSLVTAVGLLVIYTLKHDIRTFFVNLAFPNVGNLGLPLALFAFGQEGLALAVAYFMVISIAHFSIGMAVATGKAIQPSTFISNPIMWSILVASLTVAFNIQLPTWAENSVGLVGQLTIPLMLITLGVSLASIKVKEWKLGVFYSVLRLLLGGLAALFVAYLLDMEGVSRAVLILQGIMPMAVFNYLFALKSGKNIEVVASMVLISTVLAVLILPAVLYVLM